MGGGSPWRHHYCENLFPDWSDLLYQTTGRYQDKRL